ncbi:hypothetical protein [Deinococcus hopiensis]|uniref:Uncharacterized protein n=1 Tax=Deinococcus hopiensis KR-140 TaxID=695939 RepID=A0A1W1UN90_9DEIO|nr:hypothetical protein [Deinococcus hopiensis]SMB82556.1 hypothetical protein SAMN00790413_04060 [Deinococcus hopiensis KR-140]
MFASLPVKTLHLVCLPLITQGQAAPATALVRRTFGLDASRHLQVKLDTRTVEVRLPYASREEALGFARALSLEQRKTVSVHLNVNAAWNSTVAPGALTDTAHLIDVLATTRRVGEVLRQNAAFWNGLALHVQPQVNAARLVLPRETPPAQVHRLTHWFGAEAGTASAALDAPGAWLANGSRHHEVVRYQRGATVPETSAPLWT